jgi:hypothetical protein
VAFVCRTATGCPGDGVFIAAFSLRKLQLPQLAFLMDTSGFHLFAPHRSTLLLHPIFTPFLICNTYELYCSCIIMLNRYGCSWVVCALQAGLQRITSKQKIHRFSTKCFDLVLVIACNISTSTFVIRSPIETLYKGFKHYLFKLILIYFFLGILQ